MNKTDFGGEGYFAEVFLKLSYLHYERNTYYYGSDPSIPYNNYEEVKTFDIAPGVGVGRKWVQIKRVGPLNTWLDLEDSYLIMTDQKQPLKEVFQSERDFNRY